MLRSLAILLLSLVLVPVIAIAQAVPDQDLITPGVGIGPLRVGMSITEAVAVMGTPKATEQKGSTTRYFWFEQYSLNGARISPQGGAPGGLYVKTGKDGMVTTVVAYYAPQYMTDKGLHTGMRPEEIVRVLGEPTKIAKNDEDHYLFYDGIGFWVNDSKKYAGYQTVIGITVFKPESQ